MTEKDPAAEAVILIARVFGTTEVVPFRKRPKRVRSFGSVSPKAPSAVPGCGTPSPQGRGLQNFVGRPVSARLKSCPFAKGHAAAPGSTPGPAEGNRHCAQPCPSHEQVRGEKETTAERKRRRGRDIAIEYSTVIKRQPEEEQATIPEFHATRYRSGGLR